MSLASKIRRLLRVKKVPIRHGHVYVDNITGELFTIETVGRQVLLTRHDYELREQHSTPKSVVRTAVENGTIEHIPERCNECGSTDVPER